MEQEIKQCFLLYVTYMKSNIKDLQDYDTDNMSILQIKTQTNLIHMKYLMTCGMYSVTKTSPIIMGFNHLMNLINDFESIRLSHGDKTQINIDENKKGWFSY